jgi:hypothetical protein
MEINRVKTVSRNRLEITRPYALADTGSFIVTLVMEEV